MALSVLVTGGAGYIGAVLVPRLLAAGHRVTVLDRFYFGRQTLQGVPGATPESLRLVRADVRRIDAAACRGIDALVHLAGISNDPACESDPELTRSVNLEATLAAHAAARQAGVSRFVFASSCSVYGRGADEILAEDSPRRPVSLYARCKAEAEDALLAAAADGPAVTVLRFATAFGVSRRMRFDLAINVMTKNAWADGRITVEGGGQQWRPFVHIADISDLIVDVLAAEPARVAGQVLNVGSDANNVRILNLAYRVRDLIPGTQIAVVPTDPDLRTYRVAFDRLGEVFPGRALLTVDDGIREVLGALRDGVVDPADRRCYTLRHYQFLRDVEETFRELEVDGKVLA